MRVTITIEDDGAGGIEWSGGAEGPYIRGPYIRGPYIRGPHIVLPNEDGTESTLDIEAFKAAAEEKKEA
jgi:hypothetical protein